MADAPREMGMEAKLDTLIRLQAIALVEKLGTQRDKIIFLNKAGLSPKLIGDILGTSANSVSVTLSKIKRSGGQGAEGKD